MSSIRTFEVKQSCAEQQKKGELLNSTRVAGLVGLVGVVWKKSYLSRKKDETTIPNF